MSQLNFASVVLASAFIAVSFAVVNSEYQIPEPKFRLLSPQGFSISIPDEPGIQLFAFHGNRNKKMEFMENGQMSWDTISKSNGKWSYENKKLKLRQGDTIHYWLFVIKNGVGYRLDNGSHSFSDSEFRMQRKYYAGKSKM